MNRANQWWLVAIVAWASFCSTGRAASIHWRNDLNLARGEAVQSGKPLLINVSTDWCHFCRKMELETFSAPEVVDQVNGHFIPLRLDADRDRELAGRLGVHKYPATILASPDLNILSKVDGFRTPRQFQRHLRSLGGRSLPRIRESKTLLEAPGFSAASKQKLSVFGNHCPVSSIARGHFVEGSPAFALQYRGFDLRFASYAAREQFVSNQQLFWPVGDGLCAVSVLDQGKQQWGNWHHSLKYRGLIWMFASEENKNLFIAQPDRYIQRRFDVVGGIMNSSHPRSGNSAPVGLGSPARNRPRWSLQ